MPTEIIPYQDNLQLKTPPENQVFRIAGGEADQVFGIIQGGKLYSTSVKGLGQGDLTPYAIEGHQGRYNIGGTSMDEANAYQMLGIQKYNELGLGSYESLPIYNQGDILSSSANITQGQGDVYSLIKGRGAVGPDETVTRTIDPFNRNAAIIEPGVVPLAEAAPPDYLQNLLGSGQGVGGAYTVKEKFEPPLPDVIPTPSLESTQIQEPSQGEQMADLVGQVGQIANQIGGATISKRYYRYSNANEVYDAQTGQHITAEEAAKIPDFWANVEVVQPGTKIINTGASNMISGAGITGGSTTQYTTQIASANAFSSFLSDYQKRQESLWKKVKGFLGMGAPTETPEQIVNKIMPEVPQAVKNLDLKLAQLETTYQQTQLNSSNRLAPMNFIRGEQALAERQYLINKNSLLMQRDALMGDYDRATKRAEMIFEIQKDQRAEQRANQQIAISMMLQSAQGEDAIYLKGLEYQLGQQEKMEQRAYDAKIQEQQDIRNILTQDPIAASKMIAKMGYPTSAAQALSNIGSYKVGEKPNIFGSAEGGYYEQYYDAATNSWKTKQVIGGTGTGTGTPSSIEIFDSVMQGAIDNGATPDQAALTAATYAEQNGMQLSAKDRTNLVTRAKTMTKTPVAPTPVPQKTTAYGAGKATGETIKYFPEAMGETLAKPWEAGYNFFKGLFGY